MAWELFDDDHSGQIDSNELLNVLKKLGLNPTEEELQEIIHDIDKDNDGTIDYSEFLRLMSNKLKDAQTEEELLEAFKVFDI
jgi:calmodulin